MSQISKVSKNNTKIRKESGFTIVRLHNTDIVKFNDEKIILFTNGYETVTTKTRMTQVSNEYNLAYSVRQVKGNWIVTFKGKEYKFINCTCELKR